MFNNNPYTHSFDLLDYLNDAYMHKMSNTIDIKQAGGYHNRYGEDKDNTIKDEDKMLEINKKRIHIKNARITKFSDQYRENIEGYNEPGDELIITNDDDETKPTRKRKKQNRKRYNETSVERTQERGIGGSITTENVIQISDKIPTTTLNPETFTSQ